MKLQKLSLFDTTNIVIGGVVGADIWVVAGLTAGLMGPFSVITWIIAGLLATMVALVFASCSFYCPKVGGSFAYVSAAFDKFYGFIAGWNLWIAQIAALAVFPIVFVNYLQYFIPLTGMQQLLVKGLFVSTLTFINILGVKKAGILNDILTFIKLTPLFLLILGGLVFFIRNPSTLQSNYSPLMPLGLKNFGAAFVLIFWAYAGFELASLPAREIKNPRKTIHKAIAIGMLIVSAFYILTNFAVYGLVNWSMLSQSSVPLVLAGTVLFGAIGAAIIGIGALSSVSGTDEVGVLTTARLSYAMSIDGLFPKIFSKLHAVYKTPYMALIIQALIAFFAASFFSLSGLITFSVFSLAVCYMLTSLALVVLSKKKVFEKIIAWSGVLISGYLLYSTGMYDKIVGVLVILVGIAVYIFFSPKTNIKHLRRLFVSEEAILERKLAMKERFLANFVKLLHRLYKKIFV